MYRYEILESISPLYSRSPYGILCKQKINESWVQVAVAAPFSDDKEGVSTLAQKCTRLQLSPGHLAEVVVDFITETYLPT